MTDYIIAVASTADLPDTFYEENNIPCIRYHYSISIAENHVKQYEDDCKDATRKKSFANMRKGLIFSTSMINVCDYADFFRDLIKKHEKILFLDMSREMSSSYQASIQAAEMIQNEYPDRKLYIMDTRCVSGGLGILVRELVKRRNAGMSFDNLIAWGEASKLKIMHRFTVDDLKYLKRSGRVSNASAMLGSMFGIKPVLYVSDEGKLVMNAKARGRKAALKELVDGVKRDLQDPDGQTFVILHADCWDDAQWVRSEIMMAFPTLEDVVVSSIGVVIGTHCGPGLLAVFYFGDQRKA
ncbi:MAG: DegV family protein [Oscillospiraceae bacterium]|nr:DegV family protein [Oscillospiraceae bacterium]